MSTAFDRRVYRQHGRDAGNVVVPEDAFNLGQIGFVEEPTLGRRLEVDATHFHVQRVVLWSDEKVGAKGAQFAVYLVADVGGDSNHRRSHSHAQRNGRAGQEFAALLAAERFIHQSRKHR